MIKYADRGLVENGSVSPLFGKLYLVVCVTLFSVFFLFASFYYLNRNPNTKSNFHLMCIKESVASDFKSMKSIILFLSLTAPFYVILFFMLCAIRYFLRSRGFSKRVPPIIGKYKRNVLSLKETFVYAFLVYSDMILNSFLLKYHKVFGMSVDSIRFYGITHSLLINNILEGIIWPLYLLCNLSEHMPNFFSNETVDDKISKTEFHISGNQSLEPRRLIYNFDLEKNNSAKSKPSSGFRFSKENVHKISLTEMPIVDC